MSWTGDRVALLKVRLEWCGKALENQIARARTLQGLGVSRRVQQVASATPPCLMCLIRLCFIIIVTPAGFRNSDGSAEPDIPCWRTSWSSDLPKAQAACVQKGQGIPVFWKGLEIRDATGPAHTYGLCPLNERWGWNRNTEDRGLGQEVCVPSQYPPPLLRKLSGYPGEWH